MTQPEEPPEPTTPVLSNSARDANEAVSWGIRVAAAWAWRLIVVGVALYVFARIFLRIELVAFSFVLALFLTAVLHPLESRLRSVLPGPKSLPAALALLTGVAVLVAIGWFVTWQIATHAGQLSDQVSNVVKQARDWLRTGPLHVKSSDLDKVTENITNSIQKNKGALLSGAIQTVRTVAEALGALLLILLSTFFLLRDGGEIWAWALTLFPVPAQERLDLAGRVGWRTLGGYMRGQLLIALFHGVSVFFVLFFLSVPLAAALSVLIFLGSFIPLIGLTVTGSLAVAVSLLEHGVTAAIVVGVSIVVLIQLEAHLLQPFIMSRSVEVHPLAIALAVVTGTVLSGIVGALLAVPLVAFLNATIHAIRSTPATPEGNGDFPVAHREKPHGSPVDPVQEEQEEIEAPEEPR